MDHIDKGRSAKACSSGISRRKFLAGSAALLGAGLAVRNAGAVSLGEETHIRVDAAAQGAPLSYAWAFFGHDEMLWADTPNGRKLLGDLSALSPVAPYLRAHHLFTSGDPAHSGLKFTPTNAYTERPDGTPVYDWTHVDRVFDQYRAHGVRPYVELGFMPQALSVKTEPYRMQWPDQDVADVGFSHPPKDYRKWAALVDAFARHAAERYGRQEVESWLWEAWNEPDIGFWQGNLEEFLRLYDYSADAVKGVLPAARFGGPHTTSPQLGQDAPKGATYLRGFLEHALRGKNFATGRTGSPLDFVAVHTKGQPTLVDGRVQMNMQRQIGRTDRAFAIIREFPEAAGLPVYLGESDPDGTAAFSIAMKPEGAYRQGSLYPAYMISAYHKLNQLARHYDLRLEGVLSWAFQFEPGPAFAGFRELATHGVGKAILNGFRMLGLMTGRELTIAGSGVPLREVLDESVRGRPDIDAMASRDDDTVSVLLWNYHDDDVSAEPTEVLLEVDHLPARQVLVHHYRIDERHSNPYPAWVEAGRPETLSDALRDRLNEAGRLSLYESPYRLSTDRGAARIGVQLPRYGVSLYRLSWSEG